MDWTLPTVTTPGEIPELLIGPAQVSAKDLAPPWAALAAPSFGEDSAVADGAPDAPAELGELESGDAVMTAFGRGIVTFPAEGDDLVTVAIVGEAEPQKLARAELLPWPATPTIRGATAQVGQLGLGDGFVSGDATYQVARRGPTQVIVLNTASGALARVPSDASFQRLLPAPARVDDPATDLDPTGWAPTSETDRPVADMEPGSTFLTERSYFRREADGIADLLSGEQWDKNGAPRRELEPGAELTGPPERGIPLRENSTEVAGVSEDDLAAARRTLVPVAARALADLSLHPGKLPLPINHGDYVIPSAGRGAGQIHLVTGFGPLASGRVQWVHLQRLSDGRTILKHPDHQITAASPRALLPVQEGEMAGRPLPSLYTFAQRAAQLEDGQEFALAPGSTNVLTARVDREPHQLGLPVTYDGDSGASGTLAADEAVWTIPPESSAGADPAEPQTADPTRMPVIGSWDDFAPAEALPELGEPKDDLLVPFPDDWAWSPASHPCPPLGSLQPGQRFADALGMDYRVVAHGATTTAYEPIGGEGQHLAPQGVHVKVTAPPPRPPEHLEGLIRDLADRYGSLEAAPRATPPSFPAMVNAAAETVCPAAGQLPFGVTALSADGARWTILCSWWGWTLATRQGQMPMMISAGTRLARY